MLKILYPKLYASSLVEIEPELLEKLGLKGILLDLDNTIVRRDSNRYSEEVGEWLRELRARGFRLGIVSNNSRQRVGAVARLLDLPAVHRAVKPLVSPFRRAMNMLGTKPAETALIGDQIFTDIFGGNLCGLYTILVVPLKGKEFWGTRLFSRPLEKIVLARLKRYPEVLHGRWD
ncbi:Pyrophosphatase PpaX [Pelotomaculum schinkii]|uniref:Pyrophosphatase PpaX n=1 Tax=Pelotomaculum schinkii TaxID=78350 RepID=A0A4Y7RD12_9FIRM|nr:MULTISPECIES: YqeG family HAD IIIA-type phosphatase [Pelotomaculum]TEB06623.1 Pyrophosphatase PpaX [Pelotomaculum schinkii]TEB17582.1 Pyrophosphatase PpaX [Pelotomaculum sp. FP]